MKTPPNWTARALFSVVLASSLAFAALPAKTPPGPMTAAVWSSVYPRAYLQTGADPAFPDTVTDPLFFLPTVADIDAMQRGVRKSQHLDYVDHAWDCEDIAKEWVNLAQLWTIKNRTHRDPLSLAAFVVYGKISPDAFDGRYRASGGHALVLIIDNTGTGWYFEPSSGFRARAAEMMYEGSFDAWKIVW